MTDLIISVEERGAGYEDPHYVGHPAPVTRTVHPEGPQVEADIKHRDGDLLAESLPRRGDPLHHRDLLAALGPQQVLHEVGEDQNSADHTASRQISSSRCPASLQ